MLAWTDPPAPAGSGNVYTLLQNDLDLIVNTGHSTDCKSYPGNNLAVIDTNPDVDLNRGEESILDTSCGSGIPDTKNNVETVIFYPNLTGVTQFTIEVLARGITASAIPDTNCPGNPNSDCFDQDFALFIYNAGPQISLAAPTNLVATATTSTSVSVSWSPVLGADHYEISRRASGTYTVLRNDVTTTSFTDNSATANTAFLYRVRALDPANNPGGYSTPDLATTVMFSDTPIVVGITSIKAAHIDELRQAVNAVRATAGLGGGSFTDTALSGIPVKAIHIQELLSAV